jgi:uncharacterized protein YkwD
MLRVLFGSLVCAACMVPVGTLPRTTPAPPPPPSLSNGEIARGLLAEANRARQGQGLRALTADTALDNIAMAYAAELARRRTLSHESSTPGLETLTRRIDAHAIRWQRSGENLASMSGLSTIVAPKSIELWLNSTGHRANLLNAQFTHGGSGVARDQYGVWYVVQVYVLPAPR